MEKKVYRISPWLIPLGLLLFGAGCWMIWADIDHLRTGTPMMVSGPGSGHSHAAPASEVATHAVMSVIVPLAGLLFLFAYCNYRITLDMDGIIRKNSFGIVNFRARYDELESIELISGGSNGSCYKLHASGQEATIGGKMPQFEEIIKELKVRAPHLS